MLVPGAGLLVGSPWRILNRVSGAVILACKPKHSVNVCIPQMSCEKYPRSETLVLLSLRVRCFRTGKIEKSGCLPRRGKNRPSDLTSKKKMPMRQPPEYILPFVFSKLSVDLRIFSLHYNSLLLGLAL